MKVSELREIMSNFEDDADVICTLTTMDGEVFGNEFSTVSVNKGDMQFNLNEENQVQLCSECACVPDIEEEEDEDCDGDCENCDLNDEDEEELDDEEDVCPHCGNKEVK